MTAPTIMKLSNVHPLIQKLLDKLAKELNNANIFREGQVEPLPIAAMMAPLYYYYSEPCNIKDYATFLGDLEKAPDFWATSDSNILEDNPTSYGIYIILTKIFGNQGDDDYLSYNPVGYNYRMKFIGDDDWNYLESFGKLDKRRWSFSLEKVKVVDCGGSWDDYSDSGENVIWTRDGKLTYDDFVREFNESNYKINCND